MTQHADQRTAMTPTVHPAHPVETINVTTARHSHSDDIALRERRYIRMQSIRVACVVLGVLLPIPIVFKALLFVGAVVLPWMGVVMANAGPTVLSKRQKANAIKAGLSETTRPERVAIEPGRVIDG